MTVLLMLLMLPAALAPLEVLLLLPLLLRLVTVLPCPHLRPRTPCPHHPYPPFSFGFRTASMRQQRLFSPMAGGGTRERAPHLTMYVADAPPATRHPLLDPVAPSRDLAANPFTSDPPISHPPYAAPMANTRLARQLSCGTSSRRLDAGAGSAPSAPSARVMLLTWNHLTAAELEWTGADKSAGGAGPAPAKRLKVDLRKAVVKTRMVGALRRFSVVVKKCVSEESVEKGASGAV
jgi:hypothetical protein